LNQRRREAEKKEKMADSVLRNSSLGQASEPEPGRPRHQGEEERWDEEGNQPMKTKICGIPGRWALGRGTCLTGLGEYFADPVPGRWRATAGRSFN